MTALDDRPPVALDEIAMAAECVITAGYASQRLVQRKLRVGWDRAGEVLAALAGCGILGAADDEGTWPVLVDERAAGEILAGLASPTLADEPGDLADSPGADLAGSGELASDAPRVSLVKPGATLAVRAGDDLAPHSPGEVAWPENQPPRQVQVLVTRARQATARATLVVIDQPAVARTLVVGRQLPATAVRLVAYSPRGLARATTMYAAHLRDQQTLDLMAHHAERHEALEYAKVAAARDAVNLTGRRWLHGLVAALVVDVGLAWWAPGVFAGVLAVVVGVGALALARGVCREPKELACCVGVAGVLAWLAWHYGPDLASLIPQPPWWAWWVLVGLAVVGFGWVGRKDDTPLMEMPVHMAPHKPPAVTAPFVMQALVDSVPKIKEVDRIQLLMDVARDEHGHTVDLELPPGVPATEVIENREEFAAALRRELGTVWPEVGPRHPGHLACFIGHKPMATAPQADWPVAAGGRISLFEPHPLFTNRRGQWVKQTIAYTSWVLGAVPRMGKTRALLSFGLLAAFDVTARLYVWDLKGTGDLSSLAKVAHYYDSGDEPDQVEAALVKLRALRKEMRERAAAIKALTLEENPERGKVTAALASVNPERFGLRVILVDEVQVWLQEWTEQLPSQSWEGKRPKDPGKEVRDEFLRILRDLVKRGPALGFIVVLATQKPDAQSIPSAIADNVTGRLCLKVNGQVSNDQVLGTSSYRDGIRATQFAFADKGLAYLRGDGAEPQVVRTVVLEPVFADEVADLARSLRLVFGGLSGQATDVEDAIIVTDIIDDVERVLRQRGRTEAWWQELVPWLAEMRPEDYEHLTEDELSARVRARGIRVSQIKRRQQNMRGVRMVDLRKEGDDDVA